MASLAPPVVSDNGPKGITLEDIEAVEGLAKNFKKGWRTTEFWKSAIATMIPVGAFTAAIFGVDVDSEVLAMSLGGLVPNVAYILNRGWLKKARVEGLVQEKNGNNW